MKRFSYHNNGHWAHLTDEENGTTLTTDACYFEEWRSVRLETVLNGKLVLVTGRDIGRYQEKLPAIQAYTKKRIFEVGAGLGGLIPWIASQRTEHSDERPTVIDPLDYAACRTLLRAGLLEPRMQQSHRRIQELIHRCEIMLDPRRVQLVNMRLGDALEQRPELLGSADAVVDLCGPSLYPFTDSGEINIRRMLLSLLSPKGALLVETCD